MSSHELVPTTYDRTAWNTLNGVETAHHDSLLTAEQAQRINETFTVKLVTGMHGFDTSTVGGDPLTSPYQQTYKAAKNTVDSLQPGDVLLLEGYGHSSPASRAKAEEGPRKEFPSELAPLFAVLDGLKEVILLDAAERMRSDRILSTWSYAEMLAEARGIEVVNADMDKYDKEAFIAAAAGGLATADSMLAMEKEIERVRQLRFERRETKAVNTTKDWMLAHLEDSNLDGRKRTVMLMFGSGHKEKLEQAFANLGIEIQSELLDGGMHGHVRNMVAETLPSPVSAIASAIKPSTNWARKSAARMRSRLSRRADAPTNER